MTISIQPIDPVSRPFFAGEVSGIDITRPITREEATSIAQGMDQFGVYPVSAQLVDGEGGVLGVDQTLLPFWPGQQAASLAASRCSASC